MDSEQLLKDKESATLASSRIVRKKTRAAPRPVFDDANLGVCLYQEDCLQLMDHLAQQYPKGRFDMIFADPPYLLSNGGISCHAGRMVKVDKGKWDRSNGIALDHEFNLLWLSKCQQLLKPNGTIWVSGTHHSIHSVGYAMQQLGMKILNNITWEKPNPPPNLSCRYFTHSSETILWAAKHQKSKHLFNYKQMREENGDKQMKTVWNIKPPAKQEKEFGKHPTQKPLVLLNRIICASTETNHLIFDPFAGSATTGVAAILNKRQFVGCELEKDYISLSKKRLQATIAECN